MLERSGAVDDSFLYDDGFDVERQRQVVLAMLQRMPIAPGTWRLDDTAHPFATAFSPTDVRITTRYSDGNLSTAVFSALHEMGHGLYESGVNGDTMRTPLCRPVSHGHARVAEPHVGEPRRAQPRRSGAASTASWRARSPSGSRASGPTSFYRAVNKVRASLVRVDADELTYDLHVLVRFELERAMFAGELDLADLPEAWNDARCATYLGIDVPTDRAGVLQDVHWAEGLFGYFPTYSLGNIIAGQLWEAAHEALPDLEESIERGELTPAARLAARARPPARAQARVGGDRGAGDAAGRSRSARTCATCARSTARSTGSRPPQAPRRGPLGVEPRRSRVLAVNDEGGGPWQLRSCRKWTWTSPSSTTR